MGSLSRVNVIYTEIFEFLKSKNLPIYAIQFHPEVTHTQDGHVLLDNFIFEICHARSDWKMDDLISSRIKEIKEQVQDNKVLLGLSGGVDSSVTAALLHKAIGKKLEPKFAPPHAAQVTL